MCIAPAPRVTVRFSHADPFNTNHLVSTFQGRLTPFLLIRPNTTPRSPRNFGLGRAGETGQGTARSTRQAPPQPLDRHATGRADTARPFPIKLVLDFAPIGCSEPDSCVSTHPAQASHEGLAGSAGVVFAGLLPGRLDAGGGRRRGRVGKGIVRCGRPPVGRRCTAWSAPGGWP